MLDEFVEPVHSASHDRPSRRHGLECGVRVRLPARWEADSIAGREQVGDIGPPACERNPAATGRCGLLLQEVTAGAFTDDGHRPGLLGQPGRSDEHVVPLLRAERPD